jgi:hypothetical protein
MPTRILIVPVVLATGWLAPLARSAEPKLTNATYSLAVAADGVLDVSSRGVPARRFEPRVLVLYSARDPDLALRWGQFGESKLEGMYNVWTWAAGGKAAGGAKAAPAPGHDEDGFDPQTDRAAGDRIDDCYRAAPAARVVAARARTEGNRVSWEFPPHPGFELRATVELPAGAAEPLLTLHFTPKRDGWYSVAYTGAPAPDLMEVDELWQPLIWLEKRFPNRPYLTDAARCPLPATLVAYGGATVGVVADPAELPFQPLPTGKNARFGVAVRDADGKARPAVFAPMLGGAGSKMTAGAPFTFRLRLVARPGGCSAAYEHLARGLYGFRDYRRNDGLGSLNQTLANMIDYALGPFARFNDDLRGSAYETDVPGAVKNVSALHPLGIALMTDDPAVFERRARPMIEYALSREKFLFTTDPKITGQSASSKLAGPGVPLSELTALYLMSQRRGGALLEVARELYGRTRVLNLDAPVRGDTWANALALYRATGDKAWLAKAIAGADRYLADRVNRKATDFSDPDSRGMFFWPSFVPNWVELFELYEETRERRFLDAAAAGARAYCQFVYLCPTVPDGDVLVNEGGQAPLYRTGPKFEPIRLPEERVPAWRVSEIGLTCESAPTSKGHRGVFLACYAPWMLRLARHTSDAFLHDVARSAVVGRYTTFPGYHINTARTTAYEKPDFPLRDLKQLNSTTSLHYNHIWPQIAMIADYLVADAAFKSGGAIDFPGHYAEGYAYVQTKVYGDRLGRFYDDLGVWLWMPKALLACDSPELNYVAARGSDRLYVALTNQAHEPVTAVVALNPAVVPVDPARSYSCRVWVQNRPADPVKLAGGKVVVSIPARGIVALAVDGVRVQPRFQADFLTPSPGWKADHARLAIGKTHATVLPFGPGHTSAYVFLRANGDEFQRVALRYRIDGRPGALTDAAYPFEFTVPLPADARAFEFEVEGETPDGRSVRSEAGVLAR